MCQVPVGLVYRSHGWERMVLLGEDTEPELPLWLRFSVVVVPEQPGVVLGEDLETQVLGQA